MAKKIDYGREFEKIIEHIHISNCSAEKVAKMQEIYDFNAVKNSEIKFRWIRLGLRCKWEKAISLAIQMVSEQGRMKFLRPIYR